MRPDNPQIQAALIPIKYWAIDDGAITYYIFERPSHSLVELVSQIVINSRLSPHVYLTCLVENHDVLNGRLGIRSTDIIVASTLCHYLHCILTLYNSALHIYGKAMPSCDYSLKLV